MSEAQTLAAPAPARASRLTPEVRLTILLFVLSFFIAGVPRVFTGNAAYSLFIADYGASAVPYAYIAQAVGVPIAGWLYLMAESRLKLTTLILCTLVVDVAVLFSFWLGMALHVPFVSAIAMVWLEVEFVLSSLLLWGLANHLMTLRQGKRLFGFIIAGEPVGIIVCGLGSPLLMNFMRTQDLLLLSAVSMAICFALTIYITRNFHAPEGAGESDEDDAAPGEAAPKAWWKDKYIGLLITLVFASQLMYFFIDERFYAAVEQRYPDEEAMASFLGIYSAVMGTVSLIVSLFVAGPLARRFGVRGGLLTLPILLLFGGIAAVVAGVAFPEAASGLFFIMVVNKVVDQSFRYTVDKASMVTLYQPLPAGNRMKLQAFLESTVEPLTGGLAGVVLGLLLHQLHFSGVQMALVTLTIIVGWLAVVIFVSRGYGDVLRRAVVGRSFTFDPDAELSDDALATIRQGLSSRHVGEVLYALQILGDRADGLSLGDVSGLLDHGEPAVRIEAAKWIESVHDAAARPLVSARLEDEADPAVRGALIAALAASAGEEAIETVLPWLDSANGDEQIGAYQGLIRHGGIEGVIAAGNRLIADMQAEEPARRQLAAEVMQRVGSHLFYRPLLRLLDDGDQDVRAAALAAAGAINAPQLWPAIINSLKSTRLTQPAIAAIGLIGDDMLEPLAELYDDPQSSHSARRAAILACGVIGSPAAARWLMGRVEEPHRALRHTALAALSRIGHRAAAADFPRIKAQIIGEVDTAAWMLNAWKEVKGDSEAQALVARALTDEVESSEEAVFQLLGLMIHNIDMQETRLRFVSGGATQRSYVLEMLDNVLDGDIKAAVLPFLEAESTEGRRAALAKRTAEDAGLGDVAEAPEARLGVWAPASALYALAQIGSAAAANVAEAAVAGDDVVMRETAQWISEGSMPVGKERAMLLTIEKVLILRSVGIFSHVRESSLSQAAQSIREVQVKAGDTVFEAGDFGDALYIIANGRLKVHIGDKVIAEVGERQVVGEMAALNPEPRSASVTAIEDSLLLRMSSDNLERLIGDDVRVARGIIHELCDRLRKANTTPAAKVPEPA